METNKTRVVWIDVLKGWLLIMVCGSHMGMNPFYWKPINSVFYCCVPIFFIVSGYLFSLKKYYKVSTLLNSKVKTLFIPYVSLCILTILLDTSSYSKVGILSNLNRAFVECLGTNKAGPLWFLYALFMCNILGWLLMVKVHSTYVRCIMLLLLGSLSYTLSIYGIKFPFMLNTIPSFIVMYVSGYEIKRYVNMQNMGINNLTPPKKTIISGILLFIGLSCSFLKYGDMHLNKLHYFPICYISPICLFVSIHSFMSQHNFITCKCADKFIKFLLWLARSGTEFLAFHMFLLFLYDKIGAMFELPDEINFLFKFVFTLSLFYLIIVPFANNFLYRLLGKDKIAWSDNYIK